MVHISYILVVSISGLSPIQKIHGGDWMRRETIPPESPSDTRVLYRVLRTSSVLRTSIHAILLAHTVVLTVQLRADSLRAPACV